MSDISKDTVEMLANNLADFYKMEAEAEALRAQQARIEELEARLSDSTDSLVAVTKKLARAEAQLAKVTADRDKGARDYCELMDRYDAITSHAQAAEAALEEFNPARKETP